MEINHDIKDDESSPKKRRIEDDSHAPNAGLQTVHENIKDLSNFSDIEIINSNPSRKSVCLKGKFTDKEGLAIVLLEKTAFTIDDLTPNKYFIPDCYLNKVFSNDIYGNYNFFPKVELNGM